MAQTVRKTTSKITSKTKADTLTLDEARGVMLAAQSLLTAPAAAAKPPDLDNLRALIHQLGVVQIDTINVVARSQYLVLWSRLGPYDPALLDALLYPHRDIFEYWSHAASIIPMSDYPYYRRDMLAIRKREENIWGSSASEWLARTPDAITKTVELIRDRGPMASADFERPADGRRAGPWDWYGPKDSRRALDLLWTSGDLMIHSRRGGQKLYDLRERVLAEAFGDEIPSDKRLPTPSETLSHFIRRTVHALGLVTPSWLWDYFRLRAQHRRAALNGSGAAVATRANAQAQLEKLVRAGDLVPVTVAELHEPAYLAIERLPDLAQFRAGALPSRTTLLSPFDSLIWDRARAQSFFGYEVCFEAYVVPEKRRYGYYCLAILHHGRLVGRIDPKFDRAAQRLLVRAVYLEPSVTPDDALLTGLADTLTDLARFLGATSIAVERSQPETLAPALSERLAGLAPLHAEHAAIPE